MNKNVIKNLHQDLGIADKTIETVLSLLEENTVPFIARYRKEMTGGLDEEQLRSIAKTYDYQKQLLERKEAVIRLIEEKDMLTEDLKASILNAERIVDVEDLYRPYKEKRKTKATVAEQKGLKPLAKRLYAQPGDFNPEKEAEEFVGDKVESVDEALKGAMNIVSEWISDNAGYRRHIRTVSRKSGTIVSKKAKNADDEQGVYEMYYDYSESMRAVKLFRVLALNRGEKEKVLRVKIEPDEERILKYLENRLVTNQESPALAFVKEAIADAYKRLIRPSIERELRNELTEKAEERAIHVFSENLRNLLLQPPLRNKRILGIDPAFRTGCKLAVVDEYSQLETTDVIYPHTGGKSHNEALEKTTSMLESYRIDVVAIGNGTASRETEKFIIDALKQTEREVYYTIVNEAGASVYSASELAKKEFPELHVEERSAVSIARRLQDPLSELVKIDPKSIGVGQYQHDITQSKLSDALDFTVETVVNRVGVNVNTASPSLLEYVSGISSRVAKNIVAHREENGPFRTRNKLRKVANLGAKSYEQSVGFLRILNGENPLDKTPIHPESYQEAHAMLDSLEVSSEDLGSFKMAKAVENADLESLMGKTGLGRPTVEDILTAFKAPLWDPRDEAPAPILRSDVLSLEDLKEGMALKGTVRNVVDFGAFVDCGVKEDGLVHISKMRKGYVKHPLDVVKVGDVVDVYVEGVDVPRKRLQLSMVKPEK